MEGRNLRISFTKLLTACATSLTDASLLEGRVALSAGPVDSLSWLLVGASWASRREKVAIFWILMIVVSWWLVLLMWVPWALATPLVLAVLANLDLSWEHSLAVMAGTTDAHTDGAADQVLTTGAGWDGEL